MGKPEYKAIVSILAQNILRFLYITAERDLKDVCQEVIDTRSTYYQLGVALGIPVAELDSIRAVFCQFVDQALREVLQVWLKQRYNVQRHGRPTWRRLVEAVDSSAGGHNPALAKDIAERHPMTSMKLSFTYTNIVCVFTLRSYSSHSLSLSLLTLVL